MSFHAHHLWLLLLLVLMFMAALLAGYLQARSRYREAQRREFGLFIEWQTVVSHLKAGQGSLVVFVRSNPTTDFYWHESHIADEDAALERLDFEEGVYGVLPPLIYYHFPTLLRRKYPRAHVMLVWAASFS